MQERFVQTIVAERTQTVPFDARKHTRTVRNFTDRDGSILYPDSNGRDMAENDLQFEWVTLLKWNLDDMLRHNPNRMEAEKAAKATERAERLAARLRELGLDPEAEL